jgi:RHS repeat-associated protein
MTGGSAASSPDRITAAGATSITVNSAGNTTAIGSDTYAYDQANRLTGATVGGSSETYAYDGDGVRFSRTVGTDPAIRYVSDVAAGLPVTIDDGTRKYVWGLGLAYAVNGSDIETYHADRLGSVRALTDASGAVVATYRTDEWGVPTVVTGSSGQPFGFTGEPADGTGLTYLRARYYDPSLGRFLTRDAWGGSALTPRTLNRYGYVENNPASRIDPTGHRSSPSDPCSGPLGWLGCLLGFINPCREVATPYGREFQCSGSTPEEEVGLSTGPYAGLPEGVDPAQLARRIAEGHAWEKNWKFTPGFDDPSDLADLIRQIFADPDAVKDGPGGRVAFWDDETETVVIYDPSGPDDGTAFQPPEGVDYFENLWSND